MPGRDYTQAYSLLEQSLRHRQRPSSSLARPPWQLPDFGNSSDTASSSDEDELDASRGASDVLPPSPPSTSHVSSDKAITTTTPVNDLATDLPTPERTPDSFPSHPLRSISSSLIPRTASASPSAASFQTAKEQQSLESLHLHHRYRSNNAPSRLQELGWSQDGSYYHHQHRPMQSLPTRDVLQGPMWTDQAGYINEDDESASIPRSPALRHKKQKLESAFHPVTHAALQKHDLQQQSDPSLDQFRKDIGWPESPITTIRQASRGSDQRRSSLASNGSSAMSAVVVVDHSPPLRQHTLRHVHKNAALRNQLSGRTQRAAAPAQPEKLPVRVEQEDESSASEPTTPTQPVTRRASAPGGPLLQAKQAEPLPPVPHVARIAQLGRSNSSYRERELEREHESTRDWAPSEVVTAAEKPSLLVKSKFFTEPGKALSSEDDPTPTASSLQTRDFGLSPSAPSEVASPTNPSIVVEDATPLEERIHQGVHYVAPDDVPQLRKDSVVSVATSAATPRQSTTAEVSTVHWKRDDLAPDSQLQMQQSPKTPKSYTGEVAEARPVTLFPHTNDSLVIVHEATSSRGTLELEQIKDLQPVHQVRSSGSADIDPLKQEASVKEPLAGRAPDTQFHVDAAKARSSDAIADLQLRDGQITPLVDFKQTEGSESQLPQRRGSLFARARRYSNDLLEPLRQQASRYKKAAPPSSFPGRKFSVPNAAPKPATQEPQLAAESGLYTAWRSPDPGDDTACMPTLKAPKMSQPGSGNQQSPQVSPLTKSAPWRRGTSLRDRFNPAKSQEIPAPRPVSEVHTTRSTRVGLPLLGKKRMPSLSKGSFRPFSLRKDSTEGKGPAIGDVKRHNSVPFVGHRPVISKPQVQPQRQSISQSSNLTDRGSRLAPLMLGNPLEPLKQNPPSPGLIAQSRARSHKKSISTSTTATSNIGGGDGVVQAERRDEDTQKPSSDPPAYSSEDVSEKYFFGSVPARANSVRNSVRRSLSGTAEHVREVESNNSSSVGLGISMSPPTRGRSNSEQVSSFPHHLFHQPGSSHFNKASSEDGHAEVKASSAEDVTKWDRVTAGGVRRAMSAHRGMTDSQREMWNQSRDGFLKDLEAKRRSSRASNE